jgi:hypothetical protein
MPEDNPAVDLRPKVRFGIQKKIDLKSSQNNIIGISYRGISSQAASCLKSFTIHNS